MSRPISKSKVTAPLQPQKVVGAEGPERFGSPRLEDEAWLQECLVLKEKQGPSGHSLARPMSPGTAQDFLRLRLREGRFRRGK